MNADDTDKSALDPIQLGVFSSRLAAVCDEMGAVLRCSALSPNIKDRLDFSCAVFDAGGALCAQAAHIPVHLGSMAYAMADIVDRCRWAPGDMVVVNDPYLGGTHLPDVTVIAPVFVGDQLLAFVANRAHHANIGADTPGSMPLSTALAQEGVVIEPSHLLRAGQWDEALLTRVASGGEHGDFVAQVSANRSGVQRLVQLIDSFGPAAFAAGIEQLNAYGERMARAELAAIPAGEYQFTDVMDDDGSGAEDLPICVTLRVDRAGVEADFTGTAAQVQGNINCPVPVVAAAVFYVFRCLMPADLPACAGVFRPLRLSVPAGSLLNPRPGAAVAAGNVETSSRITDVVLGALAQALPERIPAASHGSMNNLAMGHRGGPGRAGWDYYETIGGGMGAGPGSAGCDGVQTHMTNTLNTPVEVLEQHYPLRVRRYALRRGSGGRGLHRGGHGLLREFEFLQPADVTVLSERRRHRPWGLAGGESGAAGGNWLNDQPLPGKVACKVAAGDRLRIETAGGGGWGGKSKGKNRQN